MINKRVMITCLTLALCFTFSIQSLSRVNSIPQLNSIVLYMAQDKEDPFIGDYLNMTFVFKNYLDTEYDMFNVTCQLTIDKSLNLTNVYNITYNNPSYNKTTLFTTGTNSTPILNWTEGFIEIAWATFQINETQIFWFIINCTKSGSFTIDNPKLTYTLNNEEKTFLGKGLVLAVSGYTNASSIPKPIRGEWVWYWWFAGSLLLLTPLIVIVITRLTLWKR